jgi:transcription elongation GreA/GreB family factor
MTYYPIVLREEKESQKKGDKKNENRFQQPRIREFSHLRRNRKSIKKGSGQEARINAKIIHH